MKKVLRGLRLLDFKGGDSFAERMRLLLVKENILIDTLLMSITPYISIVLNKFSKHVNTNFVKQSCDKKNVI